MSAAVRRARLKGRIVSCRNGHTAQGSDDQQKGPVGAEQVLSGRDNDPALPCLTSVPQQLSPAVLNELWIAAIFRECLCC
jgi:hypothetical protein